MRLVDNEDMERIKMFFCKVLHKKNIINYVKETLVNNQHMSFQSYILLNGNDIVGIIVLK